MKFKWSRATLICAAIGVPAVVGLSLAVFSHVNRAGAPAAARHSEAIAAEWCGDLRAAQSMARTAGKDILLELSAPPDDASATALERDCLDSSSFRTAASKSFILVRLSASGNSSPARATDVSAFAERLGVTHFPAFILLDADGRPYAKAETAAADPVTFAASLQELCSVRIRRDQAMLAAAAANGVERAKHLDAALTTVGTFAASEYADVIEQLIASDPDNAAGLRQKYEPAAIARRADATVQRDVYPLIDRGEYAMAIARIDQLISEVQPRAEQLQLLLAFKGQLYFTLGDRGRAAEFLNSAIAVNPTSESAARARAARVQILGGS